MEDLKVIIQELPSLNVNIKNVNINAGGEYIPEYEGEYFVIPSKEQQTLLTAEKKMKENIEISAIPYFEVDNQAGGTTVTIG